MAGEYYERLGVSTDATTDEIRSAYRERLKDVHPDVNDGRDARDRTRALIRAKDVLTDDSERARYDRLGHDRYVELEGGAVDPASSTEAGRTADPGASGRASRAGYGTTSSRGAGGAGASGDESTTSTKSRQSERGSGATRHTAYSRESTARSTSTDAGNSSGKDATGGATASSRTSETTASVGGGPSATGGATASSTTRSTASSTAGASRRKSRHRANRDASSSRRRTATTPHGGHSVGWYQGGDPSGSTPGSWSFGGSESTGTGWPFGNGNPGGNGGEPVIIPPNRILSPIQTATFLLGMFVLYPIFVYGAVFPAFEPGLRVLAAILLVLTIGFLIVMPQFGVGITGSWTVLLPVLLVVLDAPVLSVNAVVAIAMTVFTLGLALASRAVIRTPVAR